MRQKDADEIMRLAGLLATARVRQYALAVGRAPNETADGVAKRLAQAQANLRAALDPFVERTPWGTPVEPETTVTAQRTACVSCGMIYGHSTGCPMDPM